ncbi:MAG: lipase/acyltransferase domain-containing protein [Pirellulaceae bacterium]
MTFVTSPWRVPRSTSNPRGRSPQLLHLLLFFLALLAPSEFFGGAERLSADETDPPESVEESPMSVNIAAATLGGKQFWADELVHGSWRIQKNVLSGHYRLLDPDNRRCAWGTWDHCREQWNGIRAQVPPLKPRVVLVLHGLGRTRSSLANLVQYLSEHGPYEVLNITYASTRVPLSEDAKSLARVISHLEGATEINFVAHSMGNLVVRHFLQDQLVAARGLGNDPRIRRFVMLAPPNHGASLATRFQYDPIFRLIFATGGQQFTKQWAQLQEHLATPSCEFGIIAGGADDGGHRNPLLEGDDDMIVTVEETRLAGAADFVIVPALHTFIMDDPRVPEYTLRFLEHGYFVAEEARNPIKAEQEEPRELP